jgi:hypothetical protein
MSDRVMELARRIYRLPRRVAGSVRARVHRLRRPGPRRISMAGAAGDSRPAIVFFAPEAGVVPHYMAHCVVAKTLQELGHRTLIVQCQGIYPRCVVMDGQALPQELTKKERRSVCLGCSRASSEMAGSYGLDVIELRELLDAEAYQWVDAVTANLPEDLSTFQIDGIWIGQICAAEAAVTFKVSDFTGADPSVRSLLIKYLRGALLSYRAMQRLIATTKVARVIHFNEYGILLSAALAARRAGVPTTNMAMASIRGVDRRQIDLRDETLAIASYRTRLNEWPSWRQLALPERFVKDVGDDCLYRMASNSIMVYSPARSGAVDELFLRLGLSTDRRVLVAFTSSLDEIEANNHYLSALGYEPFPEKQPFRDQIEWLEALIDLVESSSDLQMVVRIHPREDINRRDKVSSGHLKILRDRFDRRFEHIRFIWPADPVSSYDLMELADVGLSAWSSTALEMARLGVPVVVAFDLHTPFPIGDVVSWAPDRDGYFRCLKEALQSRGSLDRVGFAYRWYYLRTLGCAVDLGDVIPDPGFHGLPLPTYKLPGAAKMLQEVLVQGRSALRINHEALLAEQNQAAKLQEQEAIMRQLRRCIWFLCMGEDRSTDYRLFYGPPSTCGQIWPAYEAGVLDHGTSVEFRTRDGAVSRRSRMVRRLAALAAHNASDIGADPVARWSDEGMTASEVRKP